MSAIPVGGLFFAACTALVVRPFRHPRRLALLSWIVSVAPNELPFVFLVIVVASSLPSVVTGDLSSAGDRVQLVIALVTVVGLLIAARRTFLARPALDRALATDLGLEQGTELPSSRSRPIRRRGLWWRVLFVPWPFRPRDVERVSNVAYGPNGTSNLLDVYRHRSRPTSTPTLVYFHGGGFRRGRKSFEARALLHRLARRGWTCISANYTLSRAPGAGHPQHLIDAKRVVAWARSEGERFGIDPEQLFLAGSSAGAHLSMMAALTTDDPTFQPGFEGADTSVNAAIGFYGYYGRLDDSGRPTSPSDHAHEGAPPIFLVHGTNDTYTPVEGARTLAHDLRARSRSPVVLAELPGAQHSFDVFHSIRFEAVVDAAEVFLRQVRGPRSDVRSCGSSR